MAEKRKKNNKANWMVSNSAKLESRTKQHTEFGVSASNGSRDMGRTKVAEKKEKRKKKKEMNVDNPIQHPLWGSLIKMPQCTESLLSLVQQQSSLHCGPVRKNGQKRFVTLFRKFRTVD